MNQQQALVEIGKRVLPILQEFGVEACVILGYIRTEEKTERFVAVNVPRNDASQVDGMRQPVLFATMWAAPDHPQPPDTRSV